jgi:hypothetical protein
MQLICAAMVGLSWPLALRASQALWDLVNRPRPESGTALR